LGDLARLLDRLLGGRLAPGLAPLGAALCLLPAGYLVHRGLPEMDRQVQKIRRPPRQSFRLCRYQAARYMASRYPPQEVFGSWWAGTLGYFSDRRVVNLDGVINSGEFFRTQIKPDRVQRYILEGPVRHLADFFWRDPLDPGFQPAFRAFWWEHDKEHIVQRLGGRLSLARMFPFKAASGLYILDVNK
jgi:hypothetical protein